jgi:hypothetical protein
VKVLTAIVCFLFLLSGIGFGQTERKPKYSPRKETHRNKTDALDRKQGLRRQTTRLSKKAEFD